MKIANPAYHNHDALFQTWRAAAKIIRSRPSGWMREAAGGAAALALSPIDYLLRRTGIARGVNLELALFKRAGARTR
jgi:hypothetical protein